ncbi:hypothetical protein EST38_g1463 [Candolleomyces aberdarensis]|uniref:MYND-type domain-containing protein n=1 Tax=Candolleomyces aberdarensis TaxID=2316362 RepID=A0A4Q2DUV4_9AGAR|nr:hypothetical protein EST38_g1463 [Candolleomyces aberdarensis]
MEIGLRNRPPPGLDEACKSLLSILREPLSSSGCSSQVRAALRRIDDACGPSLATRTKFAKSQPQLLRAAIGFLTLKKSPVERAAIMQSLAQCHCPECLMFMALEYTEDAPDEAFVLNPKFMTLFIGTFTTLLSLVLGDLTRGRFRNRKSDKPADAQPWPLGPDDLLPYGMKASVEAFSGWAGGNYGFEPHVLQFVGKVASFYLPFCQEVVRPPYKLSAILPLQQLENAMKRYADPSLGEITERATEFESEVRLASNILQDIGLISQSNVFFTVDSKRTLSVFKRLLEHLSRLPIPREIFADMLPQFEDYVVIAQSHVDEDEGRIPQLGELLSRITLPSEDDPQEGYNMMVIARRGGCWNISCIANSEGLRTPLCAQCDLIRYCSKKCQKEAWNHAKQVYIEKLLYDHVL